MINQEMNGGLKYDAIKIITLKQPTKDSILVLKTGYRQTKAFFTIR